MKFIHTTLSTLLSIAIIGPAHFAIATPLPASPTPSNWQTLPDTKPSLNLPTTRSDAPSTTTLIAAFGQYFEEPSYATKSSMAIQYKLPQGEMTIRFDMSNILQADGKFRSVKTYIDPTDNTKKSITIVSDGVSVWTYQSKSNQYSVQPYKQFIADITSFSHIGYGAIAFLSVPLDMRMGLAKGLLNHPAASEAFIKTLEARQVSIQSSIQETDGQSLYAYEIEMPSSKQDRFTIWVDPQTQNLKGLKLNSTYKGLPFEISEIVADRQPISTKPSDKTFKFEIPPNAKKTASIGIF
jgi:outer membrane lipoprotein-sorting protein